MREISIRVFCRGDALVHLHYMYAFPLHFLIPQCKEHDPRGSAAADGNHELTAGSNCCGGFRGNKLRSRSRRGFVIGKYFNLHPRLDPGLSASEIHAAWPATAEVWGATTGFCHPPGGVTRSISFGPQLFGP